MKRYKAPGSGWLFVALFVLVIISAIVNNALASERDYQVEWCTAFGGEYEYVLSDRTRVDCVLKKYAIEVDWGYHWAESIGQSLLYASRLNKRPGILLIMRSNADCKYLDRLREAISFGGLGIAVLQTGDFAYLCPLE